jgi:hypothetical protein
VAAPQRHQGAGPLADRGGQRSHQHRSLRSDFRCRSRSRPASGNTLYFTSRGAVAPPNDRDQEERRSGSECNRCKRGQPNERQPAPAHLVAERRKDRSEVCSSPHRWRRRRRRRSDRDRRDVQTAPWGQIVTAAGGGAECLGLPANGMGPSSTGAFPPVLGRWRPARPAPGLRLRRRPE